MMNFKSVKFFPLKLKKISSYDRYTTIWYKLISTDLLHYIKIVILELLSYEQKIKVMKKRVGC